MESIFYFNDRHVSTYHLADIAKSKGYKWHLVGSNDWINVMPSSDDIWYFRRLENDHKLILPHAEEIARMGPERQTYWIEYHATTWISLAEYLRELLEQYGGLLAHDAGESFPLLNRENILSLEYPWK